MVEAIDRAGTRSSILLGNDPEAGELFQGVVKAGCWFGSRVRDRATFALVGCAVAPGFDFADFERGKGAELVREHPEHRELIESLTRGLSLNAEVRISEECVRECAGGRPGKRLLSICF